MADYITVAEIKAEMPDTSWGSTYDSLMGSIATRASRFIDHYTRREDNAYIATSGQRFFDGSGHADLWVDEFVGTVSVLATKNDGINYTVWSAINLHYFPITGNPKRKITIDLLAATTTQYYFPAYPSGVRITATWGYSTAVPEDLKQACLIQAVRWFKRAQQGWQDTGAVVELGQLRYLQELDPDVRSILERYVRPRF